MKDIFYGILSGIIISFLFFVWINDPIYEIPKQTTGVVIDKKSSILLGDLITILRPDSTTKMFVCYDILFDKVETGDSIINGKIIKTE